MPSDSKDNYIHKIASQLLHPKSWARSATLETEAIASNLARGDAGDVLARVVLLAAGDTDVLPGPVGAGAGAADDGQVVALGGDGAVAVQAVDGDAGDGQVAGGVAVQVAAVVVLLDQDTVLGDVVEGDILVGDAANLARGVLLGLDADTVVGVLDGALGEGHARDGVVVSAAHTSDAETVAAGAETRVELDVGARVDGNAVVLVVDLGAVDVDVVGGTNVEAIGVVASLGVTGRVVDGHRVDGEAVTAVDGDHLDGGVHDVDVVDVRVNHLVGSEELRLGLATVGALGVPVLLAEAVQRSAGGTLDGDASAGNVQKRSLPLLVAEGGLALEDDLGVVLQLGEVQGGSRRDGDILEGDGRARSLLLHGVSGTAGAREGAARGALHNVAGVHRRCHDGCRQGSSEKSRLENHFYGW